MPKLNKEEIIKKLSDYIGEDTSDGALSLLEDVTDTLEDSTDVSKYVSEIEELKNKIEETDTMWREKYKARFTDYTPDTSASNESMVDTGDNSEDEDIEPPTEEELANRILGIED